MKIIVTMISTNVDANLLLLQIFCPFIYFNSKKEPNFQEVGRLVTRNISVFCLVLFFKAKTNIFV